MAQEKTNFSLKSDNEDFKGPTVMLRHDAVIKAEENIALIEKISKLSGIPVFKGQIQYLYESDFTGQKQQCPRCGGTLTRMVCNFAYATQYRSRLMSAPAGLFCGNCPTVIVDDDMMRDGIDASRFQYYGVFSVESGYVDAGIITLLNGQKPTFIFSEDMQNVDGILQSVHAPKDGIYIQPSKRQVARQTEISSKQKALKKAKSKAAKKAKKINRKK